MKIKSQQATATQENQTATDKVRHPLEDMIHASIERELSELSNSITQSVREIVQEITPKIVREIVKRRNRQDQKFMRSVSRFSGPIYFSK